MNATASQSLRRSWVVVLLGSLALAGAAVSQEKAGPSPVQVTIKDEQAVVVEPVLPVDPQLRINFQPSLFTASVRTENNQTLHLGHYASLHIDGQVLQQGQGGAVQYVNKPLPQGKDGKPREGFTTSYVYGDGLHVTATCTVVPTRPANKADKRRRDAILTHYVIENKGTKPRKAGLRVHMDTFIIDNDGCLFAAPTIPNKVLDGVLLKDKLFPPYVQLLQRPDLKNPGFVAHLTFDLGSKLEKPDRVVLTSLRVFGEWDIPAQPAGGDSALAFYWEPKEIKPGGKREFAYGYGQGIVPSPENEGRVDMVLGGSFAPGKLFSLAAYVNDPAPGQSLTLELPAGMTLVDGPEVQPVPPAREGEGTSLVYWRARVLRPGEFAVRVRSSTGVTQGKLITVTQPKG